MNSRGFDPLRLDVSVLAKEGAHLEGRWPLTEFLRLVDFAHRESMPVPADAVDWSAQGELRRVRAGDPQVWLHLAARTRMSLVCQRCLQPVEQGIDAHRSFRFVVGEEVAAELDADCEDDVLALPRVLDLRGLVEDELLLSLPLVPRHEQCALPLPLEVRENPTDEVSPHPFAALAALKGRGSLGQG